MKQASIRFLAILLIGLVVLSASALALDYFRVYRGPREYGHSPALQSLPPAPEFKEVSVRVKDWRSNQPIQGALVEIYAQVGLGAGELRGSGYTNSEGKVVIPSIKFKWHVIKVTAPGKPISPFHYLSPWNRSDTFRV